MTLPGNQLYVLSEFSCFTVFVHILALPPFAVGISRFATIVSDVIRKTAIKFLLNSLPVVRQQATICCIVYTTCPSIKSEFSHTSNVGLWFKFIFYETLDSTKGDYPGIALHQLLHGKADQQSGDVKPMPIMRRRLSWVQSMTPVNGSRIMVPANVCARRIQGIPTPLALCRLFNVPNIFWALLLTVTRQLRFLPGI